MDSEKVEYALIDEKGKTTIVPAGQTPGAANQQSVLTPRERAAQLLAQIRMQRKFAGKLIKLAQKKESQAKRVRKSRKAEKAAKAARKRNRG